MRLAAVFIFVLSAGHASGRSLHERRPVTPAAPDTQHVISNGLSAHGRRPPPAPLTHLESGYQTGFVAFGDSYSAGIGTGFDGTEDDCRHGLGAHAQLIRADLAALHGGPDSTALQFLSCTGATTLDIMSGSSAGSQVDALDTSLPVDFALLSVGGNDLGFFDVLNACVFRFYTWYLGTCAAALAAAQARVDGAAFEQRLRVVAGEILDAARWEKRPRFVVAVTGYARFFDEETPACDDMSLGVWWSGQPGPKLTRELRARMNAMVRAVNAKIRATVDAVNAGFTSDKLLFVDYDAAFDGHRFCEDGVAEPDYDRDDTWFFLVGGRDNARNGTAAAELGDKAAAAQPLPPAASALVEPESCLAPARRSGDWGELALCYMAMAKARDSTLRLRRRGLGGSGEDGYEDEDSVTPNSMWYVPTYYGKTFHPRSRGHEAIQDKIYEVWRGLDGWHP
ncbi:SGNH hydrolase [Hypoxylon sp. FL1284]|nr:SGNH hydrolase [Hypoxylon sp. FL1284]